MHPLRESGSLNALRRRKLAGILPIDREMRCACQSERADVIDELRARRSARCRLVEFELNEIRRMVPAEIRIECAIGECEVLIIRLGIGLWRSIDRRAGTLNVAQVERHPSG